jgi:UDP-galactopyranose mutase
MLSHLGEDLYKEFIYGYTKKQWGVCPKSLPAAIAKRLPFRLNYDDNYYNKKYQGLPIEGYTFLFETIFSSGNISLNLGTRFESGMEKDYDLVFYTGTIDQFFSYEYGALSYRTVYWEKRFCKGYFQGNAVINYTTENEPFTRINEPIYFEPWKNKLPNGHSVYYTEFSKATETGDEPYYPIRRNDDLNCLSLYQKKAESARYSKFIFHGRLGTYRYLDMDMVIEESSKLADRIASKFCQ